MHRLSALSSVIAAVLSAGVVSPVQAAVVVRVRCMDGAASSRAISAAVRESRTLDDSLKIPLADTEVTVDLLNAQAGGDPLGSWKAKTDAEGGLVVETGLDSLAGDAAFVASAVAGGRKVYSPFFIPVEAKDGDKTQLVHLYPTTEDPSTLRCQIKVAYDLMLQGGQHLLRARIGLQVVNNGESMYVGQRAGSAYREIWRVPLPEGASVLVNRGPQGAGQGFRPTTDGRWLVLDTPIPGLCDLNRQGLWEVDYVLPAHQYLVQTFPIPVHIEAQQATAWGAGDVKLDSAQLRGSESGKFPDPFTGEQKPFQVIFSNDHLPAGEDVLVGVIVDNAAIDQVSVSAAWWVGSFVFLILLALLFGFAVGPRGRSPDVVWATLQGDDVFEKIARLDERHERGELDTKEYTKLRDSLVELAGEELEGESVGETADLPVTPGGRIPTASREILRRIDDLESQASAGQPSAIAERAHLLEALAKTLPRDKGSR